MSRRKPRPRNALNAAPHNDNAHGALTLSLEMDRWASGRFDGLGAMLGAVHEEQRKARARQPPTPAMQLSLFPTRHFAIELLPGELAHDGDMPFTCSTELEARRMVRDGGWVTSYARVVRIEIHETDEVPLYVVGGRS